MALGVPLQDGDTDSVAALREEAMGTLMGAMRTGGLDRVLSMANSKTVDFAAEEDGEDFRK